MMDVFAALKTLSDLIATAYNTTHDAKIKAALQEIQDELFAVKRIASALDDENHALKERVRSLQAVTIQQQAFQQQANQYKLQEVVTGVWLYRLQQPDHKDVKAPYACPKCMQKNTISILQSANPGGPIVACQTCQAEYCIDKPDIPIRSANPSNIFDGYL